MGKRGEGDRGVYTTLGVGNLDKLPLLDLRTSLVLVVLGLTFGGLLMWNLLAPPF